jgi:type IV pilus assembly protein PilB
MKASSKRLGEILIEKGLITQKQLEDALKEQRESGEFLGNILISRGWITKDNLSEGLAEQFGIPLIELKKQDIDMELVHRFSSSLILDYQCFPLSEDEESVTVAIINPLNAVAISKIEQAVRPRKVNLVLVAEEDIREIIQSYRQAVSNGIRSILKKDKNP